MKNLAPIVLFTYIRFEKLKKTVQILSENELAIYSDLIIFSDGAKFIEDNNTIINIRAYLKTITGFKSVKIYESKWNKGLANSIIQGVTDVLKEYPYAIILEDDLITSKNFLNFMNQALIYYKDSESVLSISGYLPELDSLNCRFDAFFLPRSWSWGWAIWQNRWTKIDWELSTNNPFYKNKYLRNKFLAPAQLE